MTQDQQDLMRADDDGMPSRRRRVAVGTRVRALGIPCPATGIVTGHEPSLDQPVVRWPDGIEECVEDHEYEVVV